MQFTEYLDSCRTAASKKRWKKRNVEKNMHFAQIMVFNKFWKIKLKLIHIDDFFMPPWKRFLGDRR